MGTLQREDWTLEIASASPDTTAVTVYYLGNGLQVIEIMSVPAGITIQQVFAKPGKNVRRIIEVDPPTNGVLFGALPESSRARISSMISSLTCMMHGWCSTSNERALI